MYSVLIADDEIKIRETIGDYMNAKGMKVTIAANGSEAVKKCMEEKFDLIILDVMMPVMDGLEACKLIRKSEDTPILFLSALGDERDLLNGYKNGCDDYIVKPFPLSVLFEKCKAMINRYYGADRESKLTVSGIMLDMDKRKAYVLGEEIKLQSKDFQLLFYLMKNKGIVIDREKILIKIWGYDYEGDIRAVDTHIKKIRKALGSKKDVIETVVGVGYRFREEQR